LRVGGHTLDQAREHLCGLCVCVCVCVCMYLYVYVLLRERERESPCVYVRVCVCAPSPGVEDPCWPGRCPPWRSVPLAEAGASS
jgi:hypothetical protein